MRGSSKNNMQKRCGSFAGSFRTKSDLSLFCDVQWNDAWTKASGKQATFLWRILAISFLLISCLFEWWCDLFWYSSSVLAWHWVGKSNDPSIGYPVVATLRYKLYVPGIHQLCVGPLAANILLAQQAILAPRVQAVILFAKERARRTMHPQFAAPRQLLAATLNWVIILAKKFAPLLNRNVPMVSCVLFCFFRHHYYLLSFDLFLSHFIVLCQP